MSDLALVTSQVRWEQKSYWRNPLAAVFSFVLPMVFFFILVAGAGGGHAKALGANVYLRQYFTPSVLAFGVTSTCFINLSMTLTRQREAGILKRLRSTPLPAWALVGGVIGSSVIIAAMVSALTLGFGLAIYHVNLPAAHVLPLIVTILLGAAVFCSLGIAVSSFTPNADTAPALVNFPYFIIVAISGTYGPITGTLAKVANYLPLRPFISSIYRVFDPNNFGHSGWDGHDLGRLAIWGAVGVFISVRRFNWMPRKT